MTGASAERPVLFVTGHVPFDRVGAFARLHEQEGVEFALFGGRAQHGSAAAAALPFPHRHLHQRELARLAAEGHHRAVVVSTGGRIALPAAWAGARRAGVPVILWSALWAHPRSVAHAFSYPALRRLYHSADAIVVYGSHVEAYVRARGARNVHIAPQAVDNEFWSRPIDTPQAVDNEFRSHPVDTPQGVDNEFRSHPVDTPQGVSNQFWSHPVDTPQAVDNPFWSRPIDTGGYTNTARTHHSPAANAPNLPPAAGWPPEAAVKFLFVGRPNREKGGRVLVEAWFDCGLQASSAALVLVGVGSCPPWIPAGGAVRAFDPMPPTQLRDMYATADVLVVPSIQTRTFREPWGLVVNEAMNRGLPVIATDAVGAVAGGLVRDERNGLVVRAGDTGALGGAMRRLAANPELRARLGAAGRRDVQAYTYDAWAQGFVQALDSLGLSRGGRW